MIMMIAVNTLVRQKEGIRGKKKKRQRSIKGWSNRKSDARRGCSHRSISVRGIGCEGQDKIWTVVWGFTPHEGWRGLRISPTLSR